MNTLPSLDFRPPASNPLLANLIHPEATYSPINPNLQLLNTLKYVIDGITYSFRSRMEGLNDAEFSAY